MSDYKYMSNATSTKVITLKEAVAATVASMANSFREILGSEPIVETIQEEKGYKYRIHTFGAGTYTDVAEFSLQELPGCCGVLVFYHASVAKDFRNRGLGKLLLRVREESAVKAGYTMGMCTVLKTNKEELSILADWEEKHSFTNTRTGNEVKVLMKKLK